MALTTQQKPTAHRKKSRGGHHRHSKHYLKTYSPFLPLLMAVVIALAVNMIWSSRSHDVLGAATNLTANALVQDTNLERARHQQNDLVVSRQLTAAAQAKANDMVERDYWSHNAPDGTTPWSFVDRTGYDYGAAGENLAFGFMNSGQILSGWLHSPEHRANILNRAFQEIGIGITTSENYQGRGPATVVVALYATPDSSDLSVHATVSGTNAPGSASADPPFRTVSRVELLTGGATWSFAVLTVITIAALAVVVFRHALAWHRLIIRSEDFVLSHKLLDIIVLAIVVAGFLLTRTAAFIH